VKSSSAEHIKLGSAYSDTAAVTSCSRRNQYVKSWIVTNWIKFCLSLVTTYSYTAPTALGIRQEVEQITANVFLFNVFKRFFYSFHVFLTFSIFW